MAAVLVAGSLAAAETITIQPGPDCRPARPDQRVGLSLKPETSLGDILRWAAAMTCQTFRVDAEHAGRTVTVTAGEKMNVEQARGVLRAILQASGLAVRLGAEGLDVVPDSKKPRAAAVAMPPDAPGIDIGQRLVVTVVGASPDLARAIFRDAKGRQRVVGVGERIGDATILRVERDRAYVRRGVGKRARHGTVMLGGLPGGERPVETTIGGVDLRDAVKALGERRWEVTKRAAAIALKDPKATLRLVRVVPEIRNGEVFGWRLKGFGADSLPARMGLHDGDILVAINGRAAGDPDQIFAIYLELKTASRIVVTVERDGARVDLEYLVR